MVGIDLGGTGTRFARMDPEGTVLDRFVVATPHTGGAEEALTFFRNAFERLADGRLAARDQSALRAIGIGASGPIDSSGVIRNPDTLPAFSNFDLTPLLRDAFGVPSVIENDAVVAALAEDSRGAARGSANLLHVTLGTGIGVAMIVDGSPVRGADGIHPEAGHLTVRGDAPCYCGRAACWEQVASRRALQRAAERVTGRTAVEAIDSLAAAAHTPDARRVFQHYGARLGEGLATLIELYRPSLVVLGGSAARMLPHFGSALDASLAETAGRMLDFRVAPTELDDFGGAIGAGLTAARLLR